MSLFNDIADAARPDNSWRWMNSHCSLWRCDCPDDDGIRIWLHKSCPKCGAVAPDMPAGEAVRVKHAAKGNGNRRHPTMEGSYAREERTGQPDFAKR